MEQVKTCRDIHKILRTSHLRCFALQKYLEINDPSLKFKASQTWIKRFKSKYRISSRKITRLVSKREIRSEEEILMSANRFQREIRQLSQSYDQDHIINTDQCGFQYEMTSARTLTWKGEKTVFGYSQSPKNLATHSYTVQYVISMAANIKGNVFLCLQEMGGKLGPRVEAEVASYLPPNVTLTCSSSGKMSTSLNEYFIEKQLVPFVCEDALLVVDSWPGHTNICSYNKFFGEANGRSKVTLKIVPEKCTPLAQPLDTTFHRQLKYLAREILAGLDVFLNLTGVQPEDNWNTRKGVIRLQSLLHFQLSAPIFKPMIKYSWYSAGLCAEKLPFLNVKEACFTFPEEDPKHCEIDNCQLDRFLKCSQCRKCVCLRHLWLENHVRHCANTPFPV